MCQKLNHTNSKHNLLHSIFIMYPIIAEVLIMEDSVYKMKLSREEAQFYMEFFYSKLSSNSLIEHSRSYFFAMNIQFTVVCGKNKII